MMIDVHLGDNRTVVRFAGRGQLIRLIQRDPATIDEEHSVRVWLDRGQGEGFEPARLQFVKRHQIAWIEQVLPEARDAFLAAHDPEFLSRIQAREPERAAQAQEAALRG